MPSLPPDAKNIAGFEPFGIDRNGLWMFFGFTVEDGPRVNLHCNHLALGKLIMQLQELAKEAQRRRIAADAATEHKEVEEAKANPVVRMDFAPDVTGQSALLTCTMPSGIDSELQLPFGLMEKMHDQLPTLLQEMRKRQAAHLLSSF